MYERRQDHLATFMFKTMNAQVPEYISKMFTKSSDVHSYSLRNAQDNLFIPRPNGEALKHSISYRAALRWNNLTNEQRNSSTIAQFINRL